MIGILPIADSTVKEFGIERLKELMLEGKIVTEVEGGNRKVIDVIQYAENKGTFVVLEDFRPRRNDLVIEYTVLPQYNNHKLFQARIQTA